MVFLSKHSARERELKNTLKNKYATFTYVEIPVYKRKPYVTYRNGKRNKKNNNFIVIFKYFDGRHYFPDICMEELSKSRESLIQISQYGISREFRTEYRSINYDNFSQVSGVNYK